MTRPAKHKQRPHQKAAIKAVRKGFEKHSRGQLTMACGTGKTLVGMWVAEAMKSQRTVIFVPSVALIAQFVRNWCANHTKAVRMLAICSDGTVTAKSAEDDGDTDDMSRKQLEEETGIKVTTDPEAVASFMMGKVPFLVFCTYASSEVIAAAQRRKKCPEITLALCDEAHRCASFLTGPWVTIVRPDAIRAKYRLFMTATPRVFRKSARENEDGNTVAASMDDPALFGPVFHRLAFAEAIKKGLLCDYRVAVSVVTDTEVAKSIADRLTLDVSGEQFDAKTLAVHIAVAKSTETYGLRKTISFHSRIYGASEFAKNQPLVVNAMGTKRKLWVNHVSARFDSRDRLRILDDFDSQPQQTAALLTNAKCLTEGVDVPAVDAVVFADPKESVVSIVQAIGRALRLSPGKKIGTIVIPVLVEDSVAYDAGKGTEAADIILQDSSFKTLRNVIIALRSTDDALDKVLSSLVKRGTINTQMAGDHKVSPRYLPGADVDKGIKAGTMVEAPENKDISDHVKAGRVYDKKDREIVLRLPAKLEGVGMGAFVSAITHRLLAMASHPMEAQVHELIAFHKKHGRWPKHGASSKTEERLAQIATALRRKGRYHGYAD